MADSAKTMLLMACFRPADILVLPYPTDDEKLDKVDPQCQIVPCVSAEQALNNLQDSKEFIVETTKAGQTSEHYVDEAIRTWPRFKEPYLALDFWDIWNVFSRRETEIAVKRFEGMLSQGPGASKLSREYVGYHTGQLPYPVATDFMTLPRTRREKRLDNTFNLKINWRQDSPFIVSPA